MSQKVLVIGGTGMLGLPVARQLKADGFQVTIMSSNPGQARIKLADEFPIVAGDVTDPESLRDPLKGQDVVYLNLNSHLDPEKYQEVEIDGTAHVCRIATESGVKRIGMISGASSKGKESGAIFLDAKVKAERALMESGIPYTIMRPSWFFETLPSLIQGNRAGVVGNQPIKRAWLSAADYARQVSHAFASERAVNKCYYNFGPQKLTLLEALKMYCARVHPDIKPESVSFTTAKMISLLPGAAKLKAVIPFFKYFETMPEDSDPSEADRDLGPNLSTLEEWLDTCEKTR
ncbi:MAG: NAD(P)H-binding protein [candidate division Zixibacteria bacterium]|nr:NAD(P)H-binding protein [candidate division Zixibacteria bacterium]